MLDIFAPAAEPLHVTVLVLERVSLMSLAATLEPMRAANRVAGRPIFSWRIASLSGGPASASCGLPLAIAHTFPTTERTDALFIVAAFDALAQAGRGLVRQLRAQAAAGSFIIGIEAGAWVLAQTGLLDGRRATTHWEDLEDFAARFPAVEVVPDRFAIDGGFATAGGAGPALDLMLALIAARHGPALALDVASVFVYEQHRAGSAAQPAVSLGSSTEPRVARAIRLMEERLDAPLTVAAIATRIGLSLRGLEQLFMRELGCTPGAWYMNQRLGAARRLLVDARLSLAEVAARTGFASPATLSRACRRRFGVPPGQLRRMEQPHLKR